MPQNLKAKQQTTGEHWIDDGLTTCADDNLQSSDATTNMNDSSTWNRTLHGRRKDPR